MRPSGDKLGVSSPNTEFTAPTFSGVDQASFGLRRVDIQISLRPIEPARLDAKKISFIEADRRAYVIRHWVAELDNEDGGPKRLAVPRHWRIVEVTRASKRLPIEIDIPSEVVPHVLRRCCVYVCPKAFGDFPAEVVLAVGSMRDVDVVVSRPTGPSAACR